MSRRVVLMNNIASPLFTGSSSSAARTSLEVSARISLTNPVNVEVVSCDMSSNLTVGTASLGARREEGGDVAQYTARTLTRMSTSTQYQGWCGPICGAGGPEGTLLA